MSQKQFVDLDFDNVAQAKNLLDPVNYQDAVTKSSIRHHGVSQNAETSTTSTTSYVNKASLVTPDLPLGDYDITWTFKWRTANANRGIQVQIMQNGVQIANQIEFAANVSATPYQTVKKELTGISGIKTFDLNFRRVGIGSTTIFISQVHLDITKVI